MKKIIVLFKTHLDIGFTDMAKNVVDQYMDNYLPSAIQTAQQMGEGQEGFIWTAGSWVIEKFLKESSNWRMLDQAIKEGKVRWHGMPFTSHTELMDEGLIQYGLKISKKLDQRYGKQTIAAKMTDVPGHTKAMIPFLAQAGIKFLHIGINSACTRPKVPTLFWWKADTGEKLLIMYNDTYGKLTQIGDSDTAVYFAHTGDNNGPQSVNQIKRVYNKLRKRYPQATLCVGTLEDVAKVALLQENLPIIDQEIADTWIHGVGTDPRKVNQFRGLLRLKKSLSKEEMESMYEEMLLVAEHTWGLDEKITLGKAWMGKIPFGKALLKNIRNQGFLFGEHGIFTKEEFGKARDTKEFRRIEESWGEQRDYVIRASQAVSQEAQAITKQVLSEYKREPWNIAGYKKINDGGLKQGQSRSLGQVQKDRIVTELEIAGYHVGIDTNGALCHLSKGDMIIADDDHRIGGFSYEVFSRNEYKRFRSQYSTHNASWAREDFDKIGMERAISKYQEFLPIVQNIYHKDNVLVIRMKLLEEAVSLYGGMKNLEMVIEFKEEQINFDFAWWGKEATRVAEASWLEFCPRENVGQIHKIDTWIRPDQVVSCGNRRLHGVNQGVRFEHIMLSTIDSPLVSIGERSLLNFTDTLPALDQGVYCNLHNNKWGTNFPMWYEEDARFRFSLSW